MGKSLIIVESPTKIKTLKQFLGPTFMFESSYGHIRDLPEKGFGIDIENNFEPTYEILQGKQKVIAAIKKAAKECDVVYLSPDPDREGEAIAWHIREILPKNTVVKRVTFHSITKDAVLEGLRTPTDLNLPLVNAQQARRLLDRLVGYSISPLLNRRLRRGRGQSVSAGRVQSVALWMIVDRERAIEAFIPQEYWTIEAKLEQSDHKRSFTATLHSIDGKRIEKEVPANKKEGVDCERIATEEKAKEIANELKTCQYTVKTIERKEKRRNPEPPFITSTLQQEASRHFRFSPAKTMQIAQQLYEGIDLGEHGTEGLITYMRTDSVRVAPEAIDEARGYIGETFGKEFLPAQPRTFVVKKSAQDAHEGIRPTHVRYTPDMVQSYLTRDQFQLYSLIWKRLVACQMMPAVYDTVSVDIGAGSRYILRASGSIIKFLGFLALYEEKQDDEKSEEEKQEEGAAAKEMTLPPLQENEILYLLQVLSTQSFTKPPPRFTEASLIKELEKSGIGRPSTYAAIMNKIQNREYTERLSNRLKPTELGRLVVEMLERSFQDIVSIGFTAHMEDELELVAENKQDWHALLNDFWKGFKGSLDSAEESAVVPKITTDMPCPKCGAHLQKIWFKSKYFLGCENYPTCDYRASLEEATFNKEEYAEDFQWDQPCPKCHSSMKVRFGRFGPFLGCNNYPECKGIVNIPKKGETAMKEPVSCPAKGCTGHLLQKKSRFGKMYYLCSEFPACDVIGNDIDKMQEKFADREKTAYSKPQNKPQKERRPAMAVTKKAAPKKTAAKKPAAKKPAAKKPAAKKPAAKKKK